MTSLESFLPLRGRWLRYLFHILGWTAGIAVVAYYLIAPRSVIYPSKGKVGAAKTQMGNFKIALELYHLNIGRYPTTAEGLDALITAPTTKRDAMRWKGPYLNHTSVVARNPWGNSYLYQSPGPHGERYLLLCYGADGKPGGIGDAADLAVSGGADAYLAVGPPASASAGD